MNRKVQFMKSQTSIHAVRQFIDDETPRFIIISILGNFGFVNPYFHISEILYKT